MDNIRAYGPGEVIAMTVVRQGIAMPTPVTAAERPVESLHRWHFALSATLCGLGTLLGLMIGIAAVPS